MRAILLINLGGPENLTDVKPFLYRLFEDPEILPISFAPLRKAVAWLIATARAKKSQSLYATIGGGSPIRRLTDQQAQALETLLRKDHADVLVRTAFSCSEPLIENVVKDLAQKGVKRFLSLPLYPQYSYTTTRGGLARARAAVERFAPKASLEEIKSWPTHPLFIQAHTDLIKKKVREFSNPKAEEIHLLFSAHSVPEKLVTERGDPYRDEVEQTVRAVVDSLEWKGQWSLAWQSKLGPVKWLEPSTSEVIVKLAKEGQKQVLIVPIAFVTDHVETLYEIDQEMAEEAREAGIAEFLRTPGLNDHPIFIQALADIARWRKGFWA